MRSQGAGEGDLFSLDNRRLYSAKNANVEVINARMATNKDLKRIDLDQRFSTEDAGRSIEIRCSN